MAGSARGPELSELETFMLAVEEGSIARAAARLHISAPAAAKRIRQLEALSHAPLLVRGRRGVHATEAGRALYPVARELVLRRSDAVAALRGERLVTTPPDHGQLAEQFLEALRQGRSDVAVRIIDEAFDSGADISTVQSHVISPAMKQIGDLWERHAITVDEEHHATAISHVAAARLFWRAMNGVKPRTESVLLAAVEGEHHVLGLRLAADVLEVAGYKVIYLGPNLPVNSLLHACRTHEPDVLGLTVSIPLNIPALMWELGEIRKLAHAPRVMIGGRVAGTAVRNGADATYVARSDLLLDAVAQLLARDGEPPPSA